MAIVRWSPIREVQSMHNEMDRLFGRLTGLGGFNKTEQGSQSWMLPVDMVETKESITLHTAVPGVNPKDVDIRVEDNVLSITAERRYEGRHKDGDNYWVEQQYGTFHRSLTLPRAIDGSRIEAHFSNGILEIRIPKHESAVPRKIELKVDETPQTVETATIS